MTLARKDYAISYSKLLKVCSQLILWLLNDININGMQKSTDTGNYYYDVNANIDPDVLRKLYEYEMKLPVATIMRYRALAHMTALVETINSKRLQAKTARANNPQQAAPAYEKTNITWNDLVFIQSVLYEAQQESAFKSFSKRSSSTGVTKELGEDADDDTSSVISGQSGGSSSVYSRGASGASTNNSVNPTRSVNSGTFQTPGPSKGGSTQQPSSMFSSMFKTMTPATGSQGNGGNGGNGTTGSATTPASHGVLHQTMKILTAVKNVATMPLADDFDSKVTL
jgi:hypothetical protein